MKDIELVIKIPENYYKSICKRAERFDRRSCVLPPLEKIIFNGTPLQEELEAELMDLWAEIDIYETPIYDQTYSSGLKKAMEFNDKRISKLKGE